MIEVRINVDSKNVQEVLRSLPNRIVVPATVRALNKVAANVRTSASTALRKRISLSAAVVRDGIAIRRATKDALKSSIVISGKPIPLKEFKARQTRKGVTVSILPGKRTLYSGAFILGKLGDNVFVRVGKARLPIKKLVGPSLPTVFGTESVKKETLDAAQELLPKRLAEEIRFELLKIERGAS